MERSFRNRHLSFSTAFGSERTCIIPVALDQRVWQGLSEHSRPSGIPPAPPGMSGISAFHNGVDVALRKIKHNTGLQSHEHQSLSFTQLADKLSFSMLSHVRAALDSPCMYL